MKTTFSDFSKYTDQETFKKIVYLPTIAELWQKAVNDNAQEYAFYYQDKVITYEQAENDVAKLRFQLAKLKLAKRAHIGILLKNDYSFVKSFLAVTTLGYVAVLLPYQTPKEDIQYNVAFCDIEKLIYDNSSLGKISEFSAEFLDKLINIDNLPLEDYLPCQKCQKTDPAVIIFAHGTGVSCQATLLNHGAVTRGVVNGCLGYHDVFKQRYLSVIPLTHVFGLIRNLLTSIYTGSTLGFCPDVMRLFRVMKTFKPTILVIVPELAKMILTVIKQRGIDNVGGELKNIICGGAEVGEELPKAYKEFDIEIFPGYGLTEAANMVSGNPNSIDYPLSVGLPFPEQELKIVNDELLIKGDNVMDGYYNDSDATNKVLVDGWLKTGDLARFDELGQLYIIGRKKNIIIFGNGENIAPTALEHLINKDDAVRDSLVYASTSALGVATIVAEVLMNEVYLHKQNVLDKEAYFENLLNEVNKKLPTYARISQIIIRTNDFSR